MGKNSKPDYPAPPEYEEDPRVSEGIDQLFDLGTKAVNLDFTGKLAETIETSPQMTELYLKGLRAKLDPIFKKQQRATTNRLAAQGQLAGSTTASALGEVEQNIQNQYVQQTSEFGMADIDRAMRNRMELHGRGLEAIGAGTTGAANENARKNDFALNNYQNKIAYADLTAPGPSIGEKIWGNVDPLGSYMGFYGEGAQKSSNFPQGMQLINSAVSTVSSLYGGGGGGMLGVFLGG